MRQLKVEAQRIIRLQSEYIIDEKAKKYFNETFNRIRAMALIHEILYQSENLSELDLKKYIKDLVNYLFRFFPECSITLKDYIKRLDLGISSAIYLGLVISEIVLNSVKHAFPGKRCGEISIFLHKVKGEGELLISDNGIGLPEGFELKSSNSLGMQLVNTFIEQIGGRIELDKECMGAGYKIRFPIN